VIDAGPFVSFDNATVTVDGTILAPFSMARNATVKFRTTYTSSSQITVPSGCTLILFEDVQFSSFVLSVTSYQMLLKSREP
jgi:hypothetical protein